jgi:hypothetical protein
VAVLELLNEEDKKKSFVENEVCVCVAHLVVGRVPHTITVNNKII